MNDEKTSVVHFVNVECQMSNVGLNLTDVLTSGLDAERAISEYLD